MSPRNHQTKKVVVLDGGTVSDRFEVFGNRGSYHFPAGAEGTSAQFSGSVDGENFTAIGSADTVAAGNAYKIPADVFNFKYARITVAAQTGNATILLHMAGEG